MTEAKFHFLNKIASNLFKIEDNHTSNVLRSHYLMISNDIARRYNLQVKQLSTATRCLQCCLEWRKNTSVTLKPIKLSKRQRKRIKRLKSNNIDKFNFDKKLLLHGNKMEQVCSFCGHHTITYLKKPDNSNFRTNLNVSHENSIQEKQANGKSMKINANNQAANNIQNDTTLTKKKQNLEVNIYSKTCDVFALNNKANTLTSSVKDTSKMIKNNKRKKDKFAGLCEKAVLASAKFKEETQKQNKLNLFLKPST